LLPQFKKSELNKILTMSENSESNFSNRRKSFGYFLTTKTFLMHFSIALVAFFGLLFITFHSLGVITHHGEGLSVPDFRGLTLDKAIELADDKNLEIQVMDSVFNAPGKKGTVINQTPPPNFKVKEGRTIHVSIKTFNPPKIQMPDFTGVSLIQAKADIESFGLKIGKLKYVPDIATNNVLHQYYAGKPIAPGTLIEKNSRIDLVLGLGNSGQATTVPELLGLNRGEAYQKATDYSLNIGSMNFDETVITTEDSTIAIVWKQSPSKNAQSTMGSPITLWLTLDKDKIDLIKEDDEQ
jgi:eukaryotic-like serine/threonine-protein kinase